VGVITVNTPNEPETRIGKQHDHPLGGGQQVGKGGGPKKVNEKTQKTPPRLLRALRVLQFHITTANRKNNTTTPIKPDTELKQNIKEFETAGTRRGKFQKKKTPGNSQRPNQFT